MMKLLRRALPKRTRKRLGHAFDRAVAHLPRETQIKVKFFKSHGYFPDLNNPTTFSEKITWIKFVSPDITDYIDKAKAKAIVADKVGAEHVIPSLYCGPALPPAHQRDWPIPHVVKVNNSSGGNAFVRNEPEAALVDGKIARFLKYDFGAVAEERYYSAVEPQVLVEPFIAPDDQLPLDYKFFVFSGQVAFVQVDTDREHDHKRVMFDRDFNRLPIKYGYEIDQQDIERPGNFDRMVEVAEKLGAGHGFVRVDLYSIGDAILFGEFGFTPEAGLMRFDPVGLDRELGERWVWPDPFLKDLNRSVGLRG